MNWDSLPTQEFSKKPMNLNTTADAVMMFCILAAMTISDALLTLLSIPKKGIFRNQRQFLMEKTNKELRQMLMGTEIKGINRLKKDQLVDLILA
tara:strand:+ start:450 stop:731 length:282 start_codon:yes stop_codon:yes gene_type:complete